MRKTVTIVIARAQANPHKAAGFAFGIFVPLAIAGLLWAQTTGGLAGPWVDPRPPAFTIPTD